MPSTLALRCSCGQLRGELLRADPKLGLRLVCACDDCQAYAHHLGRAAELLDDNGGTDIFQTSPADIRLNHGTEHLACLRLTERGLMRWYARCCNSPVANTMSSASLPFAGVPLSFVEGFEPPSAGAAVQAALGPSRGLSQARFAHGTLPPGTQRGVPWGLIAASLRILFKNGLRRRHRPSPFVDVATRQPKVDVEVLNRSRRDAMLQRAQHAPGSP